MSFTGFIRHELDDAHSFFQGSLPEQIHLSGERFEALWDLHPDDYHEIKIHGRLVKTPRYQQAYGTDYHYTGRVNKGLPVPELLQPLLEWSQTEIEPQLNGILLNWYDGSLGHYIGKHRDSTKYMISDTPIVTMSFGESRVFRLRPWKQTGFEDFPADDGTVFIMPYATNLAWTHEVPASTKQQGRRVSVTIRAFEGLAGR